MTELNASLLGPFSLPAFGAILSSSLLYLFSIRTPKAYLTHWMRASALLTLLYVASGASLAITSPWQSAAASILAASAALLHPSLFFIGAHELARLRPPRVTRGWRLGVSIAIAAVATTAILVRQPYKATVILLVHAVVAGASFVVAGLLLRRHRAQKLSSGFLLFGPIFSTYGVLKIAHLLFALVAIGRGQPFPADGAIALAELVLLLLITCGMIVMTLEDDREAAMEAASQVEHLAYHDPLTGLPNRALFFDRLVVALTHAQRHQYKAAVLFLDIDRFKQINDSLGHSMGDTMLKTAAQRIRAAVREEDTVARFGGDEFAILIHIIGRVEDAGKIARKILEALSAPFQLGEREVVVTNSVGITIFPNDGIDAESLVKNADTAMYRAKHQGGDIYQFYTSSMNSRSLELLELETGLRKALRNNELLLHYQPLIEIRTGGIFGLEALLRWNHPQLGLLLPEKFIQTAEVSGLIIPIGRWVLQEACRQAKQWQRQRGSDYVVCVNLSARQFFHEALVDEIKEALEMAMLPPRLLDLEITESHAMQDVQQTIQVLQQLKKLGVRIAIDDFGTGYSSLSYLKQFPVDTLKLDQSFVRDMITPQDAKVVSGMIQMAHSMSLSVIAEGVESIGQYDFLRTNECDRLQGFLFSRPLPADAFDKFATHHRGLAQMSM
ncbi:MAG TPA: EAL domain-containing protein [Thermoanaerobaculia bacterium]